MPTLTAISEAELIAACRSGDRRAQAELYRRYYGRLLGLPLRYLGDRAEAIDVLNRAFLLAFQSLDEYEERGSLRAWLATIVFRQTMNYVRAKKRSGSPASPLENIVPPRTSPRVEGQLAAADIFARVRALPEDWRVVFNLAVVEGYSHREIGALLGISPENSRYRLVRARKALQTVLAPHYPEKGIPS